MLPVSPGHTLILPTRPFTEEKHLRCLPVRALFSLTLTARIGYNLSMMFHFNNVKLPA
jgi:hypothetical protein